MDYFEGKLPESEYSMQMVPGEGLLVRGSINANVTNNSAIKRFCDAMVALNCTKIAVKQGSLIFNLQFDELPNMGAGKNNKTTCKISTNNDIYYEGEYSSQVVWAMSMLNGLISNSEQNREFLAHIGVYDLGAEAFGMEFDEFVDKCKEAKKELEKNGSLKIYSNFEIEKPKKTK